MARIIENNQQQAWRKARWRNQRKPAKWRQLAITARRNKSKKHIANS
jgi:hypothetical protein